MGQRHLKDRLSNAQVVTVSAATTTYLDKALVEEINDGHWMEFKVGVAMAGGTSIVFAIQSDTDSGFATALKTHVSSGVILTAALTAGAVIRLPWPTGTQRYVRGYMTVDGTFSGGGTINCNIVDAIDLSNTPVT